MTFARFRTYSRWAYTFIFAALFGLTTFGYGVYDMRSAATFPGLLMLWVVGALVGSAFLVTKNRGIADTAVRLRVEICDLAVIAGLLALSLWLPSWLGLVRSALIVIVCAAYYGVYLHFLEAGKIVPLSSPTPH